MVHYTFAIFCGTQFIIQIKKMHGVKHVTIYIVKHREFSSIHWATTSLQRYLPFTVEKKKNHTHTYIYVNTDTCTRQQRCNITTFVGV